MRWCDVGTAPPRRRLLWLATMLVLGREAAAESLHADAIGQGAEEPEAPRDLAFDTELLQRRGIDPKVAEYFRQAPRFGTGKQRVSLSVNGQRRGELDVRFDEDGQLCFDAALLEKGRLRLPDSFPLPAAEADCIDFVAAWPQTGFELDPATAVVGLVVPTDALSARVDPLPDYAGGGVAALLNYDITASDSRFGSGSNRSLAANTELGFNAGDWIVRSRQSFSSGDSSSRFDTLYSYAQRSFVNQRKILQAGQLSINSPVFSGAQIVGLQVLPETALVDNAPGAALVEGIAESQARVEVRQNGALLYSTVVPPGPFALGDLPPLSTGLPLEVTVVEADGRRRQFTVPAAALLRPSRAAEGLSFAVGRVQPWGNRGTDSGITPWVVSAARGWALGDDIRLSGGAIGAQGYQAAGYGLDGRVDDWNFSLRHVRAHSRQAHVHGDQVSLAASWMLRSGLSWSASLQQRSAGYRELQESLYRSDEADTFSRASRQFTTHLSWGGATVGRFTTSYSRSLQAGGNYQDRALLSWSRQFRGVTANVNGQWSLGSAQDSSSLSDRHAIYASLSVPLGRSRLRLTANDRDGNRRYGANYAAQVNDQLSYSASVQRNAQRGTQDVSANVNWLPRYAQAGLGYTRYGSGGQFRTGSLRGGAVLHRDGVTLSPHPIQDTFGIVRLSKPQAGVKLNTPGGTVWTDAWGRAVIAQLPAFQRSQVDVDTKTLPRNIDIDNAAADLLPRRGSVHRLDFGLSQNRRVLLQVLGSSGQPLPKGNVVANDAGEFVTAVGKNGEVYLAGANLEGRFTSYDTEGAACALSYRLPELPDPDQYYETADARCEPL